MPALARSNTEWSSSRFSRRSTDQTCQPFALRDDVLRERHEVGGAGRRARVQHEHVAGLLRADLEDADLVVLRGRAGRLVARDPLEGDGDLGGCRGGQRHADERDCRDDQGPAAHGSPPVGTG